MVRHSHPACGARAGDRGAQRPDTVSRPSWAFALPPHAAITSQDLQSSVAPDKRWVVASRGAPMGDVRPLRPPARGREPVPGAGAPVRGAGPHEAEERSRARGGSVGPVGPPTGWRRLRQIGDQPVAGVEEFLLVDDVVAVEDGAARVAGQEHGDPFGDVRADQVAGGGAAAIVEEAVGTPAA